MAGGLGTIGRIVPPTLRRGVARALLLLATSALGFPRARADQPPTEPALDFARDVLPLLEAKCTPCHGDKKRESGLDVRSLAAIVKGGESGPAVVAGSLDQSLLYEMVSTRAMPPKAKDHLSDAEIEFLGRWIRTMTPPPSATPEGGSTAVPWSFRPPKEPPIPSDLPDAWRARVRNPVDAFVLAELARRGLTPAPLADRRTLIRRLSFDLVGLPPTPEEVAAFVGDPDPNADARLVDRLLASPHYGERWGRHWLDVARYADTGGFETDIYFKNAWRYRDYVVKSFNDDKPYDRFVQEQIAGDEIWPDNLDLGGSYVMAPEKIKALEARTGTGLYGLGPQIHESNMDAGKLRYERLTDWADLTGSLFLGLTLGCARCHDHKFDPLTQRDYFGMQAIFAASREIEEPIVNAMEIADQKQNYPRILAVEEARKACRLFDASLAGRPPTPAQAAERACLRDALAQALLAVPERAASAPGSPFDGIMEVPTVTVLGHEREEQVPAIHVLGRGDPKRPKERVGPALPALLAEVTQHSAPLPATRGARKELALWLTSPEHPLTARVLVNRLWTWHFGRGLVATPNDFGKMGQPPSHPELLDWLALELPRHGWSIKAMHRLIVLSSTYQAASDFAEPANLAADPDNLLLWRANRRRLEGEILWDQTHAVAGTINLALGGRPIMPPLATDESSGMRDGSQWVVAADPRDHARRGLYLLVRRGFRFPMFEIFDAPVNSVSCPCREVSTVAPQALWSLNNATSFRQAAEFAARLVREAGLEPPDQIKRGFQLALARDPTAAEASEAAAFIAELESGAQQPLDRPPPALVGVTPGRGAALAKFCLVLMNLTEFSYID